MLMLEEEMSMTYSLSIGDDLPAFLDPRIFRSVCTLAKDAIAYGGNHAAIRGSVNSVLQQLCKASIEKYGHTNTIDVRELRGVLHRTDPREPPLAKEGRRDPIEVLLEKRRLSHDRYDAAMDIRRVYDAFGRMFLVQARDYRKTRGSNFKTKVPLDFVSKDVLNIWHFRYKPWMLDVRKRWCANKQFEKVPHVRIVFAIVLDQIQPFEADKLFRLYRGESREVLIEELAEFGHYRVEYDSSSSREVED